MLAPVFVLYLVARQFEAEKQFRNGAFSSAFRDGFDVRRGDLVLKRFNEDTGIRTRLPRWAS